MPAYSAVTPNVVPATRGRQAGRQASVEAGGQALRPPQGRSGSPGGLRLPCSVGQHAQASWLRRMPLLSARPPVGASMLFARACGAGRVT